MNPFAELSAEHRLIERVLAVMERALSRATSRGFVDGPLFERISNFIDVYADGAHYEKEGYLFDACVQLGVPRKNSPTGFLEMEHRQTLVHAERLREAVIEHRRGNPHARFTIVSALSQWMAIIRVHIPKEDLMYFPMSKALLPEPVVERLAHDFASVNARLPMPILAAVELLEAPPVASGSPGVDPGLQGIFSSVGASVTAEAKPVSVTRGTRGRATPSLTWNPPRK